MPIQHVKSNTIGDGTNTDLIRPSDWNSIHAYTLQDAVSLSGNTAGALANISSGTFYLAGGNNITLSQNANSVTVSGPNKIDVVSLSGNTSGVLANISTGTFYLAGGNNITLSQNANSVTVSGPNIGTCSMYPLILPASTAGSTYYSGSTSQGAGGNSTLSGYTFSIYFIPYPIPCAVAFSEIRVPISYNTAAGTGSVTMLWSLGLYTNNANTLSKYDDVYGGMQVSQNSVTAQTYSIYTYATAGATSGNSSGFAGLSTSSVQSSQGNVSVFIQGAKHIKIPLGGTSTLTPGNYWLALANFTSSSNANVAALSWGQINAWSSAMPVEMGAATRASSQTAWIMQPHGAISTTFTSASNAASFFALPNGVAFTDISSTATAFQRYHMFLLRNL